MENKSNWKATYFTLGCKLNFAETSTMEQQLCDAGVRTAGKDETADVCIVNTCSVTEVADHKCRQAIHKLVRQNPGALMVVTGCYAQLKPVQVASIEGVDLVLGAEEKGQLVTRVLDILRHRHESCQDADTAHHTTPTAQIRSFMPSCSCGNRTRYFLKVQDGCNYYCTYCTIPIARGRSRNGSIASIVEQAREAAAKGGKEIVITGVNIGDFGKSTGEDFLSLIKALDEVEGIERYRISSIEPNLLTDEIIEFCAQSRAFMPHFHIPLQSGSDEVLKLMHRRYDTALFRHLHLDKRNKPVNDGFQMRRKTVTVQWEADNNEIRLNDFPQDRVLIVIDHTLSVSLRPAAETAVTGSNVLLNDIHDFNFMSVLTVQPIQKGCSETHRITFCFGASVQYQYFQRQILLSYRP